MKDGKLRQMPIGLQKQHMGGLAPQRLVVGCCANFCQARVRSIFTVHIGASTEGIRTIDLSVSLHSSVGRMIKLHIHTRSSSSIKDFYSAAEVFFARTHRIGAGSFANGEKIDT